jgi:hypothetical protein
MMKNESWNSLYVEKYDEVLREMNTIKVFETT